MRPFWVQGAPRRHRKHGFRLRYLRLAQHGDLLRGRSALPAAIANAVRDALAALGAEVNETPITPRRVLGVIRRARDVLRVSA